MIQIDPGRHPLEVLAQEFASRFRRGESPSVEEYAAQYPHLAEEISELLPFVAIMEEASHADGTSGCETGFGVAQEPSPLERLGDYRIIREIGRGGMGVVYEAQQESLGRRVAVKVLATQFVSSPKQIDRFGREAQAAANLHHTNIVPVFGAGEQAGIHYFVMQLIDGVGMDRMIRQWQRERNEAAGQWDSGAAESLPHEPGSHQWAVATDHDHWLRIAHVGVQLAEAVQYAHSQNVLHRDMKPSNILLDGSGTAWITDFGLAKHDDDEGLTESGDVVGTLRYMAPEQFDGQCYAQSDIYSLGITLYEMALLRPAIGHRARGRIVEQITRSGPPRPRAVEPTIPRDLDTILTKATALRPADRYQSGGELAEDLSRLLEDRPILARRVSPIERMWRWGRRNPAVAISSAISLMLLVLVAAVAGIGNIRTSRALIRAEGEYRRAEANVDLAISALDSVIDTVSARGAPPPLEIEVEGAENELQEIALTTADADLLQSLLSFFDALATQNGSELQVQTAEAHRRVGDIRQRLGQFEQAEQSYQQSLQIFEQLSEQAPSLDQAVARAQILNALGNTYLLSGRWRDLRSVYMDAIDVLRNQPAAIAGAPAARFELAQTYLALASRRIPPGIIGPDSVSSEKRESSSGRRHHRSRRTRSGDRDRGDHRGRDEHRDRGEHRDRDEHRNDHRSWHDRHRGYDYCQLAMRELEQLLEADPDNPDYQFALARCHRSQYAGARGDSQHEDGESALHTAIEILDRLVAQHPNQMQFHLELLDTLLHKPLGPVTAEDDALYRGRIERAAATAEKLATEHPQVHEYRAIWAGSLRKLGSIYYQAGDYDQALDCYQQATQYFDRLVGEYPAMAVYQIARAQTRSRLGALCRDRNELAASRTHLQQAVSDFESFLDSCKKHPVYWWVAGRLYTNLAESLESLGEDQLAHKYRRKAWHCDHIPWRKGRGHRDRDDGESENKASDRKASESKASESKFPKAEADESKFDEAKGQ